MINKINFLNNVFSKRIESYKIACNSFAQINNLLDNIKTWDAIKN